MVTANIMNCEVTHTWELDMDEGTLPARPMRILTINIDVEEPMTNFENFANLSTKIRYIFDKEQDPYQFVDKVMFFLKCIPDELDALEENPQYKICNLNRSSSVIDRNGVTIKRENDVYMLNDILRVDLSLNRKLKKCFIAAAQFLKYIIFSKGWEGELERQMNAYVARD